MLVNQVIYLGCVMIIMGVVEYFMLSFYFGYHVFPLARCDHSCTQYVMITTK
jgi:predicted ferric reductase